MLSARFAYTFVTSLIVVALVIVGFYALDQQRRSREREQRATALEAKLAGAQLDALRQQLQPHFLFNTLNAISALITSEPLAARRMMVRLGDMLRISLATAGRQTVPLADELEFLETYLDIQRMRFGDRLRVVMNVSVDALPVFVPSLLLQPLVENAIRHAVEPRITTSTVSVAAAMEGDCLRLVVEDDGPGFDVRSGRRDGLGLHATRTRLQQLYGTRHSFSATNGPVGGARVVIQLPINVVDAVPATWR